MKKSNFKKRALIVLSTIIGVIALFLIVVFIPIGGDTDKSVKNTDNDIVVENEDIETSGLSKKELEEKVKELEEENQELKDEVEKYKILAEQTTQAIAVPVVKSTSTDKDDKDKTSSDDKEYKDSSEYYDKNYKDYTNDDDEDSKDNNSSSSSSDKDKTPSTNTSSSNNSPNTSDTGL